jgi:ribose transport system permease protein
VRGKEATPAAIVDDAPDGALGALEPAPHDAPDSIAHRILISPGSRVGGVLLLLLLVLSLLYSDDFASVSNFRNIALDSSILLILAVGTTFLMASGGFDLSNGSVLVFSGVIGVKVMDAVGGTSVGTIAVGALGCLCAGLAWGLVNGVVVAFGRISPFIVTLGTFSAAYGATLVVSGGQDLTSIPEPLVEDFGYGRLGGLVPLPVLLALGVAIVAGLFLQRARFGRYSLIIGSSQEAAMRAGIAVRRHQLKLYALSGMLSGLAGFVSLARFSSTTITGHLTDNLNAIVAVVIGGTSLFGGAATMVGTVVGALIPSVLNNGLVIAGFSSYWQQVATGVLLIAVVGADQFRRARRD